MTEHTASSPLFEQSAAELVERLQHDASEVAQRMAREARALEGTFRGWQRTRPTPEARIAAIQQLFELHRRVMDYVSARDKTSSPPSGPPSSGRK